MISRRETLGDVAMLGFLALVDARLTSAAPAPVRSAGPVRGALLIIGGGERGTGIRTPPSGSAESRRDGSSYRRP